MPYRVQNILLIASLYDSFVFEVDGFLAEQVAQDFYLLNLDNQPNISHASSLESAEQILTYENIDIVIIHLASMRSIALELVGLLRQKHATLPIFFLLGAPLDLMFIENHQEELKEVDDFFYWNGDSKLFLAIVKHWEEKQNIPYDSTLYNIPIILIIETFIPYYSQFLPLFYEQIMLLNQDVIRHEHQDHNKTLYMKARPRVVLLHDYDSAMQFYQTYTRHIIGIISNINYVYRGEFDKDGGLRLLQNIRKHIPTLPFLLQSFNPLYRDIVTSNEGEFLYKDLPGLRIQLRRWLENEIGLGSFIFRNRDHIPIGEAKTMVGFLHKLMIIPDDSLLYHYQHDHIEKWLFTHAEIRLAEYVGNFHQESNISQLRQSICEGFRALIEYRRREKIQDWNEESDLNINLIYKIGDDSIGGKGRGLAFLNVLLNRYSNLCNKYPGVRIMVPTAAVIATGEFDKLMASHPDLSGLDELTDAGIDARFLASNLPPSTISVLKRIIDQTSLPLAVRSSSVLEDSISNPFAGVFRTFLIPNSHPDPAIRLQQLTQAVKLVYSSMFLKSARVYRENLRIPSREEKMAVIIQKVAGSQHGDHYYPLLSGVAQSYNFYPGTHMKHEEGIVTLSVGLGKTAVERGRTFAFCPRHPHKDLFDKLNIVSNSQRHLYALAPHQIEFDLSQGEDSSLQRVRISQKLCETELSMLSSVWDNDNREFLTGSLIQGPRVITFRSILQYDQYPLAAVIDDFIQLGREVMGCEVEMEFAFDVDPGTNQAAFYLLQIRPISVTCKLYTESLEAHLEHKSDLLLFSSYALGNDIEEELDTLFFIPPDRFDIVKTEEMAVELEEFNQLMRIENTRYVLIGPGRWGSSDRFLGIPVNWSQICNAKLIVEVVLPNMSIEASHGSHFFHNLFSMNVGYLTVWDKAKNDYLDWTWLHDLPTLREGKYFCIKKNPHKMKILFDGKNAVILK
ncbi:MAG: hypothetical protein FJ042_06815 [Candidatus Cloacimonetes bacterium]|nr:hypothetical protein [Candidatus Cloacimonadota bacterium]